MPTTIENRGNVEFRSILRLKPILSHELDEPIALEPLECGRAVVLHPPVLKDCESIVRNTIPSAQDIEFRFDRVIASTSASEKLYTTIGQPLAIQAMEPFKSSHDAFQALSTKSHLVICMGLDISGTSFTSAGLILKRKQESDGILPRIFDSLYSQSKHHINHSANKANIFGVNMTILQINQSKKNSNDCQIYDLLLPSGVVAPTAHQFGMRINRMVEQLRVSCNSLSSNRSTVTKSRAGSHEQVIIQQHPITMDYQLINVVPCICSSVEVAREKLQLAMKRGRQTSSKNYHSHIFINLQPLLMSAHSGRILRRGDSITILDMSRFDCKHRTTRLRDPPRADGHTAVIQCLRAIQANHTCQKGVYRKVPYLQHQLTMLLQPVFHSVSLSVTLMVTLDSSSRDYMEKKILLSEIQRLRIPSAKSTAGASIDNNSRETLQYSGPVKCDAEFRDSKGNSRPIIYNTLSSPETEIKQAKSPTKISDSSKENYIIPLPPPSKYGYNHFSYDGSPSKFSNVSAPIEEPMLSTEQNSHMSSFQLKSLDASRTAANSRSQAYPILCSQHNEPSENEDFTENRHGEQTAVKNTVFVNPTVNLNNHPWSHDISPKRISYNNDTKVLCSKDTENSSVANVGSIKESMFDQSQLTATMVKSAPFDDLFLNHMAMMNNLH